jgi:hypothetical protein
MKEAKVSPSFSEQQHHFHSATLQELLGLQDMNQTGKQL